MPPSRILIVIGLAAALMAGCAPTATGIQARADARDRLDAINANVGYDQAMQAFEVGRFERAERAIDGAIAQYPDAAPFHVLRGRIMLETNRLDLAIECFLQAAELDPDAADAQYFAGIVYQRWSDDEQAHRHYRQAAELEPSNVQYHLAAAEALVALGELDAAREMLEPELDRFEHHAAMHHLLGQIAMLDGDADLAVGSYAQACLLAPDDLTLREELARAQFQAGRHRECLETLRSRELAARDDRIDLALLQGRCLALLERSIEARDVYLDLTRRNPSDPNVWVELGTVAWELGDFHRVAQCSARIIALAPERFEGYMLRGANERYHGNLDQAVVEFGKAAERAPDVAMPHLMLGLAFEESGDMQGAGRAYTQALRIDPDSTEAKQLLERWRNATRLSSAPAGP